MQLAKIERSVPIKAIPEKDLNTIIITEFTVWIANLLSLTDETSAQRLETALPAVKEHCWSMGFDEIKKMFEMYADGKLSVKPLPNYFDRILFGKIVEAYKQQKPMKKESIRTKQFTDDQKELMITQGVVSCFDHYVQDKYIPNGYQWVHDHLDELNLMEFKDQEKKNMWDRALVNARNVTSKESNPMERKNLLLELEKKHNPTRILEYKKLRLARLFDRMVAKNQHVKDFI